MSERASTGERLAPVARLALVAGLAILVSAGCATPLKALSQQRVLDTGVAEFEVLYAEQDAKTVERVEESLRRASQRLERWGSLRKPVTIRMLPSHEALEEAVDRKGYTWLRAWARYDEIFLQSPRTWSLLGATQNEVDELILHELAHCLMYQSAGTRSNWPRKRIPLWFREGMASYTAQQGYRWPTLEELARFLRAHPERDPVTRPEALYQRESDMVYAAAHHAFSFLVRRYGEAKVRDLFANMSAGAVFPDAFANVMGVSSASFEEDFKRYVRLRGFRGGRLRVGVLPAP